MSDRPSILFVEDHAAFRVATARLLERAGFHVRANHTPAAALAELDRAPAPDLIIQDLIGPHDLPHSRDVIDRAEILGVPVLLLSGYPIADAERLFDVGRATAFLQKPVDHTELLAAIHRLIGSRSGSNWGVVRDTPFHRSQREPPRRDGPT